ncbi:MAG: Asp-tRNA(Asn)/Glu-tRNA(Gln) amidotransferase subunit GatA [Bacillota bacterium]|nr:Asp-tRNA(Asn)/Glu-tRNA(Gln) amidotransferase subunit GatA [Bacillota bacterium]
MTPLLAASPSITALTAAELRELLRRREVSAADAWQAYMSRAAALDPALRAFLEIAGDTPEVPGAPWETHPLLGGVPFALKDNICARGLFCTCGSRILEGFRPPYDATVTVRLREAGAMLMGKTNMDEFAMGSSCEHSGYFATANPWALDRVPGGSSGGAAAAVAADMTAFALGSDTGGSVRQPASFCGIVGLKPTYGLVSRYGLVAFASSLDQIGPLTKDVTDCALVLSAIAGHDPMDSTSARVAGEDYTRYLVPDIKGMRLGVPREYMGEGIEPGVRAAVERAVAGLNGMGAEVEECSLPHTEYGVATYYIIAPAEASSNLARYDGVRYGHRAGGARAGATTGAMTGAGAGTGAGGDLDLAAMYERTRSEGFGAEVRRRIMIGTYVLSAGYYDAYYLKAQKARTLVKQDFENVFARFDALVTPTAPTVAFPIGAKTADPLQMYLNDVFTIPVNMAGLPGISIPCGLSEGLPVGLQLIGPHMGEPTLLRLAYAYETASGIRHPRPAAVNAAVAAAEAIRAAGGVGGVAK